MRHPISVCFLDFAKIAVVCIDLKDFNPEKTISSVAPAASSESLKHNGMVIYPLL